MTRSLSFAVLALAVSACEPDLPQTPTPTAVTVVFDPANGKIPLPNDLAFMATADSVCGKGVATCAQLEFLAALGGTFPNDQPVAVTLDFSQTGSQDGKTVVTAPDLDLATVITTDADPTKVPTVFVYSVGPGNTGVMPLEPVKDTDYSNGTLTLHYQDDKPWPAGSYVVAVRGGANGVKTKDGLTVASSTVFHLIKQGRDMTDPKNMNLLRTQTQNGTYEEARALGTQLNLLIALYQRAAFPAVDTKFPHEELAIAATFSIAPLATHVRLDPATGEVPLPFDLLRDPTTGKLSLLAACTLAGSQLRPDGTCPSAAAAGFQALDGFSTTGMIVAGTSGPIDASTVTPDTVMLFEIPDSGTPTKVSADSLIYEPCEVTSAGGSPSCTQAAQGLASSVALQPAGVTAGARTGDASAVLRTKPLKDNTYYGVVITTGVHDAAGKALGSTTAAKLLRLPSALIANGTPTLSGVDAATAGLLEPMRARLAPVFNAGLADRTKVAMAYTFHTQTIASQAVQLAALPYTTPAATAAPGTVTALTPAQAFTKYGVIPRDTPTDTSNGKVPLDHIEEVLEVDITTFNALDPASGAFLSNPANAAPEAIHVLIATPKAASAPDCAAGSPLAALGKCAPMMIFRHGLGSGRAAMLTVADTFAANGMVTVAIDAAKHGDRSLCSSGVSGTASGCVGTCTKIPNSEHQGDAATPGPPGTCDVSGLVKRPVMSGATGSTDGIAAVSSNYLVSANLFRTRDTLRQDLIDESQLIRAIAFAPSGAPPTGHTVFDHVFAHAAAELANGKGMLIDPTRIYYTGQSLGAIQGAMNVASNPRISKAGLNVGGGTIVDVFSQSDTLKTNFNALLTSLGINPAPTTAEERARLLQFFIVTKTVLDPADPINFVGHLTDGNKTLPNLLPPLGGNPDGTKRQDPKTILNQMASCDHVVPNLSGFLFASNTGSSPLPPTGAMGTFELFSSVTPGTCTASSQASDVPHSFLTDWSNAARTQKAQDDIAAFVKTDTLPASVQQH